MDDGCYNLRHPLLIEAQIKHAEIPVYFITLHASARAQSPTSDAFTSITLTEVLPLIFNHDNSITWSWLYKVAIQYDNSI